MNGKHSGAPSRALPRRQGPMAVPLQRSPSEPQTFVSSRRHAPAPPAPARILSALAGALVGLLAVGLVTWAQGSCDSAEVVCGRSQATTLSGLLLLPLIGAGLLAAVRVRHPWRTSLAAVGLLTVVVMLFAVDSPMTWARGFVVVVLSAGSFTLARKLTATYVVR